MITLKPWQFPLASAESRAAARAILENREEDTRPRVELILNVSRPARTRARATTLEQSAFGRTVVKGQRRDAAPHRVYPHSLGESTLRWRGSGLPRVWDALQQKQRLGRMAAI